LRKTASLAILTTFLLIAAALVPLLALADGPVMTGFYGEVTINDAPAPVGTGVTAYMEGTTWGPVETGPTAELPALEDNEYWLDASGTEDDTGKTVNFVVTYEGVDYTAPQTGTFEIEAGNVDLAIEVEVEPTPGPVMTGFYGEVTLGDGPAPLGTGVTAYMGGTTWGPVETGPTAVRPALADNEYWLDASGTTVDIGETVSFKVGYGGEYYDVPQTGTFQLEAQNVDLSIAVPTADFSGSPRRGVAPLTVDFTDESTGCIYSWEWDFGDGTTSTEQNPTNTYSSVGSYDVSLTVTGPGGSDTETKTDYITVLEEEEVVPGVPPGPAKFVASYLHISPEQVVPSQWVEISINLGNKGGTEETHTVALYINGYLADSQAVPVSPGSSKNVVFRVRADSEFLGGIYVGPGTYKVNVEGMEGQFFVLAPEAPITAFGGPLGTGGIIVIVVVVIALVCGLFFGLRRE